MNKIDRLFFWALKSGSPIGRKLPDELFFSFTNLTLHPMSLLFYPHFSLSTGPLPPDISLRLVNSLHDLILYSCQVSSSSTILFCPVLLIDVRLLGLNPLPPHFFFPQIISSITVLKYLSFVSLQSLLFII